MAKTTLTGGCHCRAVRYEISGAPGFSFLCQCRRCQQLTGTGHAPGFKAARDRLSVAGNMASYKVEADSGHQVTHEFCSNCGSPLYSSTTQFRESVAVYAASLDNPSLYNPERVIFHASAQPWDWTDPSLPK
jgi:hypothetical protein